MNEIQQAAQAIVRADALLIGASNGLSIAEGYHVFANNEMFRCQFGDFQQQYGIRNVIEGCFFHYLRNDTGRVSAMPCAALGQRVPSLAGDERPACRCES